MPRNHPQMPRLREPMVPGSAVMSQAAPSQSGVADPNVPPYVPTQQIIVPQSTPTSSAWQGNQVQVDIIIDKNIGKALNFTLQFDLNVQNIGTGVYLASSSSLVDRIDWLCDGQTVETTYADMLFYENVVFKQDQELAQEADLLGVEVTPASGSGAATVNPAHITANGVYTYWLPLSGPIASMQPFVKGIKNELRIRLYLSPVAKCNANGFASDAGATVNLQALNLWVEEGVVSAEAEAALLSQHASYVSYRAIGHSLWTRTQPSLSTTNKQTDILTAFTNDSAGLLVYLKNPSQDPGFFMERLHLTDMQLLNAGGSTLTRTLPASYVEGRITPSSTPVGSAFVNSDHFNTYIFPFCSSLERARNAGKVLGGLKLTGNEQLVITPAFSTGTGEGQVTSATENVISYDYMKMTVNGGYLSWSKTAA